MDWIICFAVAALFLVCTIALCVGSLLSKKKTGGLQDITKILCAGVAITSVVLFIPVYLHLFREGKLDQTYDFVESGTVAFLMAIHNTIRLFVVDGDFDFIINNVLAQPQWLLRAYIGLFGVLFVAAPFLTFSFVLSFFKNISAYTRYYMSYGKDIYVFSELNERSVSLAESLDQKPGHKRVFVFTDVFEQNEEESYELIERAKDLNAILFKKDIVTIDFSFHSKHSELNFFAIGMDENENINQALKLIEKLKYRDNTKMFVFSISLDAEILLTNAFACEQEDSKKIKIKVRRVNEVRSLINHNLYDNGFDMIFQSARPGEDELEHINAVVVGMGHHGTEMTKALTWFCQMDGYRARIDSFDLDDKVASKFQAECPELIALSGKLDDPGEAQYTVCIHPGIDVDTVEFENAVRELPRTTYVFVALGSDERNIQIAVKLRALFTRLGYDPTIQAVVYNTGKKNALEKVVNFKGMTYDIDFIGDTKSSYSEEVILDSDLEEVALSRHTKWGSESDFWRFDYNYKSSIASAIHRRMKALCKIPGADQQPKDRSEEALWNLRKLEHRRWNAYMRSEGYSYAGTIERSGRNDMAKLHNCLVTFDELPLNEQIKDDD